MEKITVNVPNRLGPILSHLFHQYSSNWMEAKYKDIILGDHGPLFQ